MHLSCRHEQVRYIVQYKTKHAKKHFGRWFYEHDKLCHPSILIKDLRYIVWMDKTGLTPSNSRYPLSALAHKYNERLSYEYPCGFDHTTVWRKPGDRFPLLVLTEPYDHFNHDEMPGWDNIAQTLGLKYEVIAKSPSSLWYPNSTAMVFWWCPKYYDFDRSKLILEPLKESEYLYLEKPISRRKVVDKPEG